MNKPKMMMMHANQKGTGCSFRFELHPAKVVDGLNVEGSIVLDVAHQMTVGRDGVPSRFDFENTVSIRLYLSDVCLILQVFRGECEQIEGGIKKIFDNHYTLIELRHLIDPLPCYQMVVTDRPRGADGADNRFVIAFTSAEALGICEAMAGALGICEAMAGALVWMAFGDPRVCHCAEGK